jgi:ketosteroid isomerase-like protein
MSHPTAPTTRSNAQILRSAYDAFAAGDVPAVLAVFSEDITWHISGRSPIAGDNTGHDEVVGFFQDLGERSNGTFRLAVLDILDSGADTVAARVALTAERNGAHLAVEEVQLWRFENAQATSFRDYPDDAYAHD